MRTHELIGRSEDLGGAPQSTFKLNACYFRSQTATLPHRRNWARVQGQRSRENRADRGSSETDLRMIEFAEDPREHAPIWRMCFSCRCRHGVSLIASWKWRMSRCCQLSNMMFSVPSGTSCPTASVPLRPTKPLCFLILFHDSRCLHHLNQPRHENSMHSKASLQSEARDEHYCGQDCLDLWNFPTSIRIDFLKCSRHARAIGQCGGSLRGRF